MLPAGAVWSEARVVYGGAKERENSTVVSDQAAWTSGSEVVPDGDLASDLRQLALVDRVIGLEAALAQASAISTLAPVDRMTVEFELARVKSSKAWRVGRLVVAPMAFAARAGRVVRHRLGL
jgi:hypothetical protein